MKKNFFGSLLKLHSMLQQQIFSLNIKNNFFKNFLIFFNLGAYISNSQFSTILIALASQKRQHASSKKLNSALNRKTFF